MKRHVLAAALTVTALALTMPFAASAQNAKFATRVGLITAVSSDSITLNNGMTVYEHQGTIINPTGFTLYPGTRVRVYGMRQSHYRLDARRIDVIGARGHYQR